jgi:hypothetical protein
MSTNILGELVANNGTYFLHNGTFIGSFDQIIIRGKGVEINNIYVNRNNVQHDVTEEYISNILVPDGLRITPKNDEVFTEIRIATSLQYIGVELVLSA